MAPPCGARAGGASSPPAPDTTVAIPAPCLVPAPPLPDTLAALFERALEFNQAQRHVAADSIARAALAIAEASPGPDSFHVARSLDVAVRAALPLPGAEVPALLAKAARAVALKEARFGPEHAEVAASLVVQALATERLDPPDRTAALALCRRALAIREACLGPRHRDVGLILHHLAGLVAGSPADSLVVPYLLRAIAILEQDPDDPVLAEALRRLGGRYIFSESPEAGVEPLRRALAIHERTRGPRSGEVAATAGELGWALIQSGAVDEGIAHFERARTIRLEQWGPDDPRMAGVIWNLSGGHQWKGDYERAATLGREALRLMDLRPNRRGLGDMLRMHADRLLALGEYAAARDTCELAIRLNRADFGDTSTVTAASMTTLAQLLSGPLGSPVEAVAVAETGLSLHREARRRGEGAAAWGDDIFDRGWVWLAAECHLAAGDTTRARPLVDESAAMFDRRRESTELNLLMGRADLVRQLRDLGRFDEARARQAANLRVFERAYPPGQPDYARAIRDMADLECRAGRPEEAERLLAAALAGQERSLGTGHPEYSATLLAMARARALRGEGDAAVVDALRAEETGRDHARLAMRALSERRSLGFAEARPKAVPLLVRLALDGRSAARVRQTWDAASRSRALVLDELGERRRSAAGAGDCSAEYAGASEALAKLIVRRPGGNLALEDYAAMLAGARRRSEEAEERLAKTCATFRAGRERRRAGLAEAEAALPPDAALVAYLRVPMESLSARDGLVEGRCVARRESPDAYVAFVLPGAGLDPVLFEIGPAARVDSLVEAWRSEAGRRPPAVAAQAAERRCREAGEALREAVWDPVAKSVAGARQVFVVPDGALNLMSLAALPDAGGGWLVESGARFHCVSAERDLARRDEALLQRGLLAIGAPSFDDRPPAQDLVAVAAGGDAVDANAYRGAHAACADFRALRFKPLPATGREVEDVASAWAGAAPGGALVRRATGAAASEAAFKREAGSHRVLHVATHGFFVGEGCGPPDAGSRGIGGLSPSAPPPAAASMDSPLLLSGLALAGANRRDEAGPDEEDGILTAEEIAALDLSGVEWAVLSACETGVGEVRAGEGVFGLRRAFQVAGARTLIMSLWPVEDEATRAWMGHLYRARLEEKLDTAESVRAASLKVLAERRARGESTHPFYWGAFVAAGDWR